jgi:hypothetical protein
MSTTYYDVLSIASKNPINSTSPEINIEKAYLKTTLLIHPDKIRMLQGDNLKKAKKILEALKNLNLLKNDMISVGTNNKITNTDDQIFKAIGIIHTTLMNPEEKKKYDESIGIPAYGASGTNTSYSQDYNDSPESFFSEDDYIYEGPFKREHENYVATDLKTEKIFKYDKHNKNWIEIQNDDTYDDKNIKDSFKKYQIREMNGKRDDLFFRSDDFYFIRNLYTSELFYNRDNVKLFTNGNWIKPEEYEIDAYLNFIISYLNYKKTMESGPTLIKKEFFHKGEDFFIEKYIFPKSPVVITRTDESRCQITDNLGIICSPENSQYKPTRTKVHELKGGYNKLKKYNRIKRTSKHKRQTKNKIKKIKSKKNKSKKNLF